MFGTGVAESQDCSGICSFRLRKMHNRQQSLCSEAGNDQASDIEGTITACIVVRLLIVSSTSATSSTLSQTEVTRPYYAYYTGASL